MHLNRIHGSLFAATLLLQAGCGGGAGSGGLDVAHVASSAPPIVKESKTTLAQLPAACASSSCIPFASASVDASGEFTVLWSQTPPGSSSELHAANFASDGTMALSSGIVERDFVTSTVFPSFSVRPLGARRFLVLEWDQLTGPTMPAPAPGAFETIHARVVGMQAAGAPILGPQVLLPAPLHPAYGLPALVQDGDGKLYAFAPTSSLASSPIDLGLGQPLALVAEPIYPFATINDAVITNFEQSISPRALWAVSGTLSSTGDRQMYLADVLLSTGQVLLPANMSTQTFATVSRQVACVDRPAMQVQATSDWTFVVAWRQVNASKYATGAWATVSVPIGGQARGLGINAKGQGVLLFTDGVCAGATCEELAAYRF